MKPALAFILVLLLSWMAAAQPAARGYMTNGDVVILAKAGFSEDFIIDTIQASRTHFDTAPASLAEMAKEGITERLVRVVAGVGVSAPEPAAAGAAPAAATQASMETVMPGMEQKNRTRVVNPTRVGLAITSQTPYYQTTSFFFGLLKWKVAVGVAPQADQIITPQMAPPAAPARPAARPAYSTPVLVAPANSAVRYVVLP